jgi:diguanylate cyclase (GGDEF)-like protein/PAS domain S-box-containing protein
VVGCAEVVLVDSSLAWWSATATEELVDRLPDAVVVIDGGGLIRRVNRAAERLVGSTAAAWVGASGMDLVHPDDIALAAVSLASVEGKEVGTPIELRIAAADGWRLVELVGAPLGDGYIALSMRDLTQRRRWEIAGGEVARFRSLVQHASSITMLLTADGHVSSVSGAITRLLGLDPELVCEQPLVRIVHDDDQVLVTAAIGAAVARPPGAPPTTVEALLRAVDGTLIPFELSIVSLLDDPTVRGLVVSGHDITRLRQAQDSLAELANFDALTGLPNRRAFDIALEREWTLTSRDGIDSYVVVGDLDGFKELNDSHGHAAGDEALRQVAHALRSSTRHTDVIARLGGDEFAVILIRCGDAEAAVTFDEELRARLVQRCRSLPSPVRISLGSASLRDSTSGADALHAADTVMLTAKRAAKT